MAAKSFLLFLTCDDGQDIITRVIEVPCKQRAGSKPTVEHVAAPQSLIQRARRIQIVHEDGSLGPCVKDRRGS